MDMNLNIHDVTSIEAQYEEIENGPRWIELTFTNKDGAAFQVTSFVTGPMPIKGAELLRPLSKLPEPA